MSQQRDASELCSRKEETDPFEDLGPRDEVRAAGRDDFDDADHALASKFGYKPVFRRKFGYLSSFSFAVSISGLFATIATTFSYPLYAGGSSSAVWCWFIGGAGCMCIALSVAEIVSAYPTCGGLYYSVSRMTPKPWIAPISWVTGWINLLGQIAGIASSEWGAASLLLAAVSIGSDFKYSPTIGQTVGVMAGLTVTTGLVNTLSTYWIEKITKTYVMFHVLVLVGCSVALLAMAQPAKGTSKHNATYVFTDLQATSGWTPSGFSFLFDFDACAHISEEIREPEVKAPWAISMAMLFTYVAGWLYNIVLCFVMGDPQDVLASPLAQPVAQIFYNVLGKAGGMTFTVCAFVILKFVTFTAMQATSRAIFAFSRDKLLPFSHAWTKILPLTGTPILAVWIAVFWCIAINLIGLGSYTAISGVYAVCAISLDWSYCIPIICKLAFNQFQPGPWHMGPLSKLVNILAVLWTTFSTIIFFMPTALPVSASNMNYAVVYFFGILMFCAIYWVLRGRKSYTGPLVQENLQLDDSPKQEDMGRTRRNAGVMV